MVKALTLIVINELRSTLIMDVNDYEATSNTSDLNYAAAIGLEGTTFTLALSFCLARMGNRYARKVFTTDDAVMILGTVLITVITCIMFRMYRYHSSYPHDLPTEDAYNAVGELVITIFVSLPIAFCLIRVSIISTYLRIFPAETNVWVCYSLFGAHVVYAVWAAVAILVQCRPIRKYWDRDLEGHCINPENQDIAMLVINSAFDIIVYTWPVHYLYKLKISVKARASLIVQFSFGLVSIALSIARLVILRIMYNTKEFVHYGFLGTILVILETHIGVMCACLPYLRFVYDFFVFTLYGAETPTFRAQFRARARYRSTDLLDKPERSFLQIDEIIEVHKEHGKTGTGESGLGSEVRIIESVVLEGVKTGTSRV
ncbi:hypothetical protein P280DRAFT_468773 [Massarina eburnea CBS 473.64]|uniref:Rhodopsin domain-containing protein n=1 Tax=Massarina eburnea CBS 473.64 TaxID=1395130 RepID=A0A6A6S0R7_9PLEO|nr:hypothetical protein P280DRAFT_468773 [Massarina eburnea CBS 473.64]